MISITNLAAEKVKEIAGSEGLAGQGLRLRVIGGGCAGFQYDLYFEDKQLRFEVNPATAENAKLTVSSKLLHLAKIRKGGAK